MNIPVIDFSTHRYKDALDENLTKEFRTAFTEVGFVYLKNTGITQQEVDAVMEISKKFFLQSEEFKLPFSRKRFVNNLNHGWVSSETERLNPRRPGDLKEAFNTASLRTDITIWFPSCASTTAAAAALCVFHQILHKSTNILLKWPSAESVTGFREMQASFFLRCKELSLDILGVMAHSLGLEADVFINAHKCIGSDENGSTLRSLYYPPVRSESVKAGQLRCGEHSDYGSITLVFQSHEGGLQVLSRSGEYISAPSIPGTVLINIADLMQRWTSDTFISAVHRVLLPASGDSSTRQSLAFFVQPDDEALVTCCDGSNKYPPVKAGAYLIERFNDSYGKN